MFGAGSDTTASAMSVAVMAAACYPEAAERVKQELDTVIGRERRESFLLRRIYGVSQRISYCHYFL